MEKPIYKEYVIIFVGCLLVMVSILGYFLMRDSSTEPTVDMKTPTKISTTTVINQESR
jgi:hypothetical protein